MMAFFFITITCSGWRHLFHLSDGYAEVYKWFDHLKGQGHYIVGYVIMPNHAHALNGFRNTQGLSINLIIGEGKRFFFTAESSASGTLSEAGDK